jgi:hypothetical protein
VDTEHRFGANFKAILAGLRQILRVRMLDRIGGKRRAGTAAEQACGADAGTFAEPLVGCPGYGIVLESHGTAPDGGARNGLRLATRALSGGIRDSTAGSVATPLYRLTTRWKFELTKRIPKERTGKSQRAF